jgi:hypothetical protein
MELVDLKKVGEVWVQQIGAKLGLACGDFRVPHTCFTFAIVAFLAIRAF